MKFFFCVDRLEIKVLRPATDEEVAWYRNTAKEMQVYKENIDRFQRVNETFLSLSEFMLQPPCNAGNFEKQSKSLVANYLYAFNEFLDQWETFIIRKYGKENDYYDYYKKLTSTTFDNFDEYKITYALRNFQHVENVVDGFSFRYGEIAKLTASRERILKNKSFTKLQRKAIEQQPQTIDLFPIFSVAKKQLENIEKRLMFYTVTKQQEKDAQDALELKMKFCKEGTLIIGNLVDEKSIDLINNPEQLVRIANDGGLCSLEYENEIPWGVCNLLKLFRGTNYKDF